MYYFFCKCNIFLGLSQHASMTVEKTNALTQNQTSAALASSQGVQHDKQDPVSATWEEFLKWGNNELTNGSKEPASGTKDRKTKFVASGK